MEPLSGQRTAEARVAGHGGRKSEADEAVTSLPPAASANGVFCQWLICVVFSGWCQLHLASHGPAQHPEPLGPGSCTSSNVHDPSHGTTRSWRPLFCTH